MAETVSDTSLLSKAPKSTTRKRPTAPAKKAAAKKAPAKAAAAKPAKLAGAPTTRAKLGPAGWLQDAILKVCTAFADGNVETDGKPLTPHRIAKLVEADTKTLPSSGAVAACLARWNDYGFAVLDEKPVAFKRFTPAGKKKGLEELVDEHRKKAYAARKAAKG